MEGFHSCFQALMNSSFTHTGILWTSRTQTLCSPV